PGPVWTRGMGQSMSAPLRIRLLGSVEVNRGGVTATLPRSRKVRALLGYLALATSPLSRGRLCDLLWDVPNDPRGELRWCLSKLRGLLDDVDRRRVIASISDGIQLDLSDCDVDAIEVDRLVKSGVGQATRERLVEVCDRIGGDLLDGTELDDSPELTG